MKWLPSDPEGEWKELCVERGIVRYMMAGEGTPLILIHGLSGSVRWWLHNIPSLSRHFRVYALDLIEYQPAESRRHFLLPEAAHRISLWMRRLGLKSASLIGHSMGGAIAATLAADAPELIDKLILVNPAALFPRARLPLSLPHLVIKAPHFSPTLVPVLLQDAWRTGPRLLFTAARDLVTSDLRPKLPRIQAETLVVWGRHDGILPPVRATEICDLIPHSRLCVLPKAGHNPMWEQPEEFNAEVLEFLGVPKK